MYVLDIINGRFYLIENFYIFIFKKKQIYFFYYYFINIKYYMNENFIFFFSNLKRSIGLRGKGYS